MKNKIIVVHGFSLSELMVSLFLSSVISIGLFKSYFLVKDNYLTMIKKIRQHQEQLLIMSELQNAIGLAGFSPCLNLSNLAFDKTLPVIAIVQADDKTLPTAIRNRAVAGSDIIIINRMDTTYSQAVLTSVKTRIGIAPPLQIKSKDKLLMVSCYQYHLSIIANLSSSQNSQQAQLVTAHDFQISDRVYLSPLITQLFYIGHNSRKGLSLFMSDGRSEEISDQIKKINAIWLNPRLLQLQLIFKESNKTLLIGIVGR